MKKINLKSGAMAAVLAGTMALSMVPATAFANEATVSDQTGITKTWTVASKNQYDADQEFKFDLNYKGVNPINGNPTADPSKKSTTVTLKGRDLNAASNTDTKYTGSKSFADAFSGVNFSKPGEYYFELSEENTDNPNVKYDAQKYTVRVNVVWDDVAAGNVKVDSVQTIKGAFESVTKEYTKTDKTSANFNNTANGGNGSLAVTKKVTGMAANTSDKFTFTVKISGVKGTYAVNDTDENSDNAKTVTAKDGTIDATFSLDHDETVTIENLPNDATWTVTENANEKGYKLYDLKSSDTADKTASKANGTISNNDSDTATFTNDKGFAPQTGITMNSLGGIAIAVVAVAGGATLVISRRKRAGQDF